MMRIINLGILAHVDAGKTTLTEQMLVLAGAKKNVGRVDDGTTTTDSMELEKRRGMTIRASTVSFEYEGVKINLIDTPGHMEFIAEVERSLAVLNGAVLVVSAREGVQPQTRAIYAKLREMGIPTIFFINKIDRVGASIERTVMSLREQLRARVLMIGQARDVGTREAAVVSENLLDGELFERIVNESECLLEAYLNDTPLNHADLFSALRQEMISRGLCCVYCGAALKGEGVRELLEALINLFDGGGDSGAPLSALAYKAEWADDKEKRLYLRVFSGALVLRSRVNVVGLESPVHIKNLLSVQAGALVKTDAVYAGDIGVLLGAAELRTGDFIGEGTELPGFNNEQPLLTAAVKEKRSADRPALIAAFKRLNEEDPSLNLTIEERTGEISIRLFGSLQSEIIRSLLFERFGLDASFSELMTIYKDHPKEAASAELRIGQEGNHHEAGIALTIEPLPPGEGIGYESCVSYGALEKPFQNAVAEGVKAGLNQGLGYEIVDAKVVFTDMDYSSVTSTPADYRRLASVVVKMALEKAGLYRMEPWVRISATVPADAQKRMLLFVGKRRATLKSVEYGYAECTVAGEAPLDEMKDFASEIAMMSRGEGIAEVRFLEYRRT